MLKNLNERTNIIAFQCLLPGKETLYGLYDMNKDQVNLYGLTTQELYIILINKDFENTFSQLSQISVNSLTREIAAAIFRTNTVSVERIQLEFTALENGELWNTGVREMILQVKLFENIPKAIVVNDRRVTLCMKAKRLRHYPV